MYGFVLLLPFLLIRFGLLVRLDREAVSRAAYFAPVRGGERTAYWVYQISSAGILLAPFFLKVSAMFSWQMVLGLICYVGGLCLCAASIAGFAAPDAAGLNTNGIYRISRNPMYGSYFICFMGMALLTRSWIIFGMTAVFKISAHWIIIAKERWCLEKFGEPYERYMKTVRRYI